MAIDKGSETKTYAVKERTWRIEVYCEFGEDPTLRAHREVVSIDENGKVAMRDRDVPLVERKFSTIAEKSFEEQTGKQLADLLAAWADGLRHEDLAAIKAREEAAVPKDKPVEGAVTSN